MRTLAWSALIFLPACGAPAPDQDGIRRTFLLQAQKVGRSMVEDDHETLADLTHPEEIRKLGGRKVMIQMLEELSREMRAKYSARSVTFDAVTEIRQARDDDWFGIAPFSLEMRRPGVRVTLKSFLVGVSKDGGRNWKFLDGGDIGVEKLKTIMPSFPEGLSLPKQQKPVIEKLD